MRLHWQRLYILLRRVKARERRCTPNKGSCEHLVQSNDIGNAYIRSNACYYELRLSRLPDGVTKIFVVPCIYLSVSLDVRSVRVHSSNLSGKWPIGTYHQIQRCISSVWRLMEVGTQPVSALVVKMVGKSNNLPMAAWAMTLFLNKSGCMSCVIWNNPTWWSTTNKTTLSLSIRSNLGPLAEWRSR